MRGVVTTTGELDETTLKDLGQPMQKLREEDNNYYEVYQSFWTTMIPFMSVSPHPTNMTLHRSAASPAFCLFVGVCGKEAGGCLGLCHL